MAAVAELLLVLGLLVSAHCEVRARDPEVEEEEELGQRGGGGGAEGFGMALPPPLQNLPRHPGVTPAPGEGGNYPARTGNWCAFVHRRMVSTPVACGTEKYTIRSQSPCPNGTPDCQLVMYKLSTRPVYREKQRIFTALLWRCCPGHGGENCEDSVSDGQPDSANVALTGGPQPGRMELHAPVVYAQQQQRVNPHQEQNDHQPAAAALYDAWQPDSQHDHNTTHPAHNDPGHAHNTQDHGHTHNTQDHGHAHNTQDHGHAHKTQDHGHAHNTQDNGHAHSTPKPGQTHNAADRDHAHKPQDRGHVQNPHHHPQDHDLHGPDEVDAGALPYPDALSTLPVPDMMALVMSQLQPILQGFNHSLEKLSRRVGELAGDVAQLKSSRLSLDTQREALGVPELEEGVEERFDAKLDETFQHIEEVRRQVEINRADMEDRLHSQHAMLHYNLTGFKTDVDMKLKRNQKMLQTSLQAMNATLTEMKLDQDQMFEDMQRSLAEGRPSAAGSPPPPAQPPQASLPPPQPQPPPQSWDASALWEAIERLDNKVVNNTVKVNGLVEDMEETSGSIRELRRECKNLEDRIVQQGRTSQVQFMETVLEVDQAKEVVLTRVNELAGNLTQQGLQMQEMESDLDYLFKGFYKNSSSSGDCDCKALKAAISLLEQSVANVTELANENQLALDGTSEAGAGQWGAANDWELAVKSLQHGLQQVKESLAFEQGRTRTLQHNLTQLSVLVAGSMTEVAGLQEADRKLLEEMRHLPSSFASLLNDGIRHSDVLEMLLGEEVLEFLDWPLPDQEAHSIPALKEQMQHMQEQLSEHNLSITSLLGNRPGGREEVPAADQPSSSSHLHPDDWLPGGVKRRSGGPTRERQLLHPEGRRLDYGVDGGDLWNLEKTVEALGLKVQRLEEKPCCNNSRNNKEGPSDGVDAKLQAEVLWLKRGLEEHLRVFKNVFSNAEVLADSDATLDLDKLWTLVKNKDGKREKRKGAEMKRGGKEGPSGRGNHRSRRDTSGHVPALNKLVEKPLLFLAGSPQSIQDEGFIVFEASLNRGEVYSSTGTFTAPVDGTYLFVLTLDLRPGPAHIGLRRSLGGALASLHREEVTEAGPVTRLGLLLLREGEEVQLELREGELVNSQDNVFAGLLLHHTT